MPDLRDFQGPIGPVRGGEVVTVDTTDIVDEHGFLVQANAGTSGNLVVEPMQGGTEFTLTVTDGDEVFELAGTPCLCRAVKATSTVASFIKVYP